MKKEIVSGLLCLGVATAMAEDRTFPHAGGSDDMASAEAWGGTLPTANDQVIFSSGATETVTASTQVAFGYLQNGHRNGYNEKLIFDMRDCDDTLNFKAFIAGIKGNGHVHTYFKGGTWDFGGGPFCWGNTYYGDNRNIFISDGAVIGNMLNMYLGYTAQDRLRVELTGQSQLSVGGEFKFTNNKTAKGNENWLKITDGSTMTVIGNFAWESNVSTIEKAAAQQPYGGMFYKDLVLVSGEGSKLTMNGQYNYLGQQGGSETRIEDGAVLKASNYLMPWSGCLRNNLFRVDNATATLQNVYAGWSSCAGDVSDHSNRVEVVNHGTLTADVFYMGYAANDNVLNPGNTLLVSNATFEVRQYSFGHNVNCSNQYALVQGPDAVFRVTQNWTLFTGAYSEFCVDLGATITPPNDFGLYVGGRHHDTLRVRNGGKLTLGNSGLGTSANQANVGADKVNCWNNRIVADADGIIEGPNIKLQGDACSLEITDATVTLPGAGASQQFSINVGYSSNYGGVGTNCVMSIAGSRPRVTLGNKLLVQNNSRLVYKLPANGYDDGVVPLVCDSDIELKSGCSLVLEGAEEMCTTMKEKKNFVLAENPAGKKFFTAAQVEAVAATLPKEAKLKLVTTAEKNQLVLRAGRPRGLIVTIR